MSAADKERAGREAVLTSLFLLKGVVHGAELGHGEFSVLALLGPAEEGNAVGRRERGGRKLVVAEALARGLRHGVGWCGVDGWYAGSKWYGVLRQADRGARAR